MRFKSAEAVSMIAAGVALIGAAVSAFIPARYTYESRSRELNIKLVEIGIGILRADPKEKQTQGAREWAIQVIETNSGHRFSDQAKNELLKDKLDFQPYSNDFQPYGPFTGGNWSSSGFGDPGKANQESIQPPKR